jgi:23S rRNA pseudouridine1911/1915/1917 synthase
MPHDLEIIVPPRKQKERIDLFLTHHIENATRNKVQQAIERGLVLVDGKKVRSSHQLTGGEIIQVRLPRPEPQRALPENIPLDILYEDSDVLVVNKPAGMVTHPAHGNYTGTLVNALLYHCTRLSTLSAETRPGIVHRLDKDTSGVMVIAKTDTAHTLLARQFSERTIGREYWAVVWGTFKETSGTIEAELGRSKSDRKKIAVVVGGKHAITEYEVIERFAYLTLVRLRLRTGRTHQIRVHLAHINHPVFGDPTYHGRRIAAGPGTAQQKAEVQTLLQLINRQALHAKTLEFTHPRTGERMSFDSPLPADISAVLALLRRG